MEKSNQPKLVTVFGGSGFLGRHIVRLLAKKGFRIRVACRRPDLAGHLQPLGNVGQITAVQANLRYRDSVDRAVVGADYVVNCVGILFESGRNTFDAVQAFGANAIAEAISTSFSTGFSTLGHDVTNATYTTQRAPSPAVNPNARGSAAHKYPALLADDESPEDFVRFDPSAKLRGKVPRLASTFNVSLLPGTRPGQKPEAHSVRDRYEKAKDRVSMPASVIQEAYRFTLVDYQDQEVERDLKYFWHTMLHDGVIIADGKVLQPLFDHEGFSRLKVTMHGISGMEIRDWYTNLQNEAD